MLIKGMFSSLFRTEVAITKSDLAIASGIELNVLTFWLLAQNALKT